MVQLLTITFSIYFFLTTSLSLAAPNPDAINMHPSPHPDTNPTNPDHIYPHDNNTSQLDKLCHEIAHLEHLVHELNATTFNTTEPVDIPMQPHQPNLNLTSLPAMLANTTAQLQNLTANATLAGLCRTAGHVEHDCFPLMGLIWANLTGEVGGEPWGNSTVMNGGKGEGRGNGTRMGMMPNATAVAGAGKNATLVAICKAWVVGMTKGNLSETDAALAAVENVTSTSAPGSTSTLSGDSSTGTGSTSGAVQSATLSGNVAVYAVIILAGIIKLG